MKTDLSDPLLDLEKLRENLTEYENKWKNYAIKYWNKFENDIKNTFDELIHSFKNLSWELETFSTMHEYQTARINLLMKFL